MGRPERFALKAHSVFSLCCVCRLGNASVHGQSFTLTVRSIHAEVRAGLTAHSPLILSPD
jgi:hypothetical protein